MYKIIFLILLTLLTGCATITYPPPEEKVKGFYHQVKKNETLLSISKAYGISLQKIIDANRLPNANRIEIGQLIFIPSQYKKIDYDSRKIQSHYEAFIWPVKGKVLSYFGSTDNYTSKNKGIDISASYGEDIVAARSGKVTYCSDFMKGYGKIIIIDHDDGFQTIYAYNSSNLMKVGDYVRQRQVIAKVGKGGRAKAPSLHFEIRKEHEPQNPSYYLP